MLTDIDLDVKNYAYKQMPDDGAVIYLRSDPEDNRITSVVSGETSDLANMLIGQKDIHDIILMAAAYIVIDGDIDFEQIKENLQ